MSASSGHVAVPGASAERPVVCAVDRLVPSVSLSVSVFAATVFISARGSGGSTLISCHFEGRL